MKAIVYARYGSANQLKLAQMDKPDPGAEEILIKIVAVSINGADKENLQGKPLYGRMSGLFRPGKPVLGSDIAGRVEAVGSAHTRFKAGDAVYGELVGYRGGFAEYVCSRGETLAIKPPGLTFEQAAAIPQAGTIAYRAVRTAGKIGAGDRVLVNGAGGSGGSFIIPLAKIAGAEITAVDSAHKLDHLRELGADQVIDYQLLNFATMPRQYDLVIDLIASNSIVNLQRVLRPGGRYFYVGGCMGVLAQILLLGPLIKWIYGKKLQLLAVPQNREDLVAITRLVEQGLISPVIDRCFPLEQTPQAFQYIFDGLAKGKVVICVE